MFFFWPGPSHFLNCVCFNDTEVLILDAVWVCVLGVILALAFTNSLFVAIIYFVWAYQSTE